MPSIRASAQSWRLIRQNSKNLGNLLIDRHTRPAITDFWNPTGGFTEGAGPISDCGLDLARSSLLSRSQGTVAASPVFGIQPAHDPDDPGAHGRLIYIVPLIGIICALPVGLIARWLARRNRLRRGPPWRAGPDSASGASGLPGLRRVWRIGRVVPATTDDAVADFDCRTDLRFARTATRLCLRGCRRV